MSAQPAPVFDECEYPDPTLRGERCPQPALWLAVTVLDVDPVPLQEPVCLHHLSARIHELDNQTGRTSFKLISEVRRESAVGRIAQLNAAREAGYNQPWAPPRFRAARRRANERRVLTGALANHPVTTVKHGGAS